MNGQSLLPDMAPTSVLTALEPVRYLSASLCPADGDLHWEAIPVLVSKGMNNAEVQWGRVASEKSQQEVSEVPGASKVPGQTILIQLPTRVSGWPSRDISARFTKLQTS